ncbi:MAG: TIM-barrel domain-containing protein [Aggregatilineales bacterium]
MLPSDRWHRLDRVETATPCETGVALTGQGLLVEICALTVDCLRFRCAPVGTQFDQFPSGLPVVLPWPQPWIELKHDSDTIVLRTAALRCHIQRDPYHLSLETLDGRPLVAEAEGLIAGRQIDEGTSWSLRLREDDRVYGLGFQPTVSDLRGRSITLWSRLPDAPFCLPFALVTGEAGAWGVYLDHAGHVEIDVGAEDPHNLRWQIDHGVLSAFLFAGSVDDVVARFRECSEMPLLPPTWLLGVQGGARDAALPAYLDSIHLARNWSDGQHIQRELLTQLVRTLQARNKRVFSAATPVVSARTASTLKPEWLIDQADGRKAMPEDDETAFYLNLEDIDAQAWWKQWIARTASLGFDGLVLTRCAPEFPATLVDVADQRLEQSGVSKRMHKRYPVLAARIAAEGLRHADSQRRWGLIASAGSTGQQAHAATVIGRPIASWEALQTTLNAFRNLSISGIDLFGLRPQLDLTDEELFLRTLQTFGLLPLLDLSEAPIERLSEPYQTAALALLEMRKRFQQFFYGQLAVSREYKRPLLRFDLDRTAAQFAIGDALIVAPVLNARMTVRSVTLPDGEWVDYWTGKRFGGGQRVTVDAPVERLPLFLRAGVLFPLLLKVSAEEDCRRASILRVFPGRGATILYEDDGLTRAYETGDYRWIYVDCEWRDKYHFAISRRVAGRYRRPESYLRIEIMQIEQEPHEVRLDRQNAPLWYYDDQQVTVIAPDAFQRLEIILPRSPSDRTLVRRLR